MMKSRAWTRLGVLSWFVVLAGASEAVAKPDFSGTWTMNAEKSTWTGMPAPDRVESKIVHADPSLKVAVTQSGEWGEWSTDFTYTTDGAESVNKTQDFDVKSVVAWEGDALVIKSNMDFQGSPLVITDRWTLSDDGKTMTIDRQMKGPMGEGQATIVMERQ